MMTLVVTCHTFWTPRFYRSFCRFDHTPFNAVFYGQPEFRARIFGSDKSLSLTLERGGSIAHIVALAATPEEAAKRANAAVPKVQAALSRLGPITVTVIELADPTLAELSPFFSPHHRLWLGMAAIFGFSGVLLFLADFFKRK
jgi:hypothetical protein